MPSVSASLGECRCTGAPSQRIWPSLGAHRPDTVLIRTDLPAPLSPASAVTLPAGTVKSTVLRAWTAPNALLSPRSSSSSVSSSMSVPPESCRRPNTDSDVRPPATGDGGSDRRYSYGFDNTQRGSCDPAMATG